jgi:glycosyltransferase involved in cell wall biosynthesis
MKFSERRSVCFVTNTYPDSDTSYRGVFIKRMAGLLERRGYSIAVVTPKIYRDSPCLEKKGGPPVYRFPFFSGNRLLIEREKIPYLRMIMYYVSGMLLTLFVVLRRRCDLIHVHWAVPTGMIGVFCQFLLRKPLVVTVHGSDFRLAAEGSRLIRSLFLFVCRRANHLTCVSEVLKKGLCEWGLPEGKISCFPMGVDGKFLEAGRCRREESERRSWTVLSNRNLLPLYNVSMLIQAIPLVLAEEPNTRFVIGGEGREREKLEREVKDLNVERSVSFIGRISHETMPDLLGQSDIYVSTSLSDGTSVSLLEAMATGTFPVVTDIPANREWIKDGENGFLVPVKETEALARRIVGVMRSEELRRRSCAENLRTVEEKALWSVTIRKTEGVYEDLLNREPHFVA